jgi:hypothetical protein
MPTTKRFCTASPFRPTTAFSGKAPEPGAFRVAIVSEVVGRAKRIAVLAPVSGGTQSTVRDVDAVVYSTLRLPANDLWLQLRERHPNVRCIGDAASPWSTADVIQEGEEAARLLER